MIELIYILTCFLWGCYAVTQQRKENPHSGSFREAMVGIVNMIGCPICILWAVVKNQEKNN